MEVYGIDSLLQPASSGQSMNYSLSHLSVGFTRESGRLPLGPTEHIQTSTSVAKSTCVCVPGAQKQSYVTGIFVAITNNTLYGSKLSFFFYAKNH